VKAAADKLYAELLAAGVDVILDDRNERPAPCLPTGSSSVCPHRVTIGDRGLKEGVVEYQHRRDKARHQRAGGVTSLAIACSAPAGMIVRSAVALGYKANYGCSRLICCGVCSLFGALAHAAVHRWKSRLVDAVRTSSQFRHYQIRRHPSPGFRRHRGERMHYLRWNW